MAAAAMAVLAVGDREMTSPFEGRSSRSKRKVIEALPLKGTTTDLFDKGFHPGSGKRAKRRQTARGSHVAA